MRKLKLHLEDLSVSTFEPEAGRHGAGTVRGHDDSEEDGRQTGACGYSVQYSCINQTQCAPVCPTGYPNTCWISWDPAARCAFPA